MAPWLRQWVIVTLQVELPAAFKFVAAVCAKILLVSKYKAIVLPVRFPRDNPGSFMLNELQVVDLELGDFIKEGATIIKYEK